MVHETKNRIKCILPITILWWTGGKTVKLHSMWANGPEEGGLVVATSDVIFINYVRICRNDATQRRRQCLPLMSARTSLTYVTRKRDWMWCDTLRWMTVGGKHWMVVAGHFKLPNDVVTTIKTDELRKSVATWWTRHEARRCCTKNSCAHRLLVPFNHASATARRRRRLQLDDVVGVGDSCRMDFMRACWPSSSCNWGELICCTVLCVSAINCLLCCLRLCRVCVSFATTTNQPEPGKETRRCRQCRDEKYECVCFIRWTNERKSDWRSEILCTYMNNQADDWYSSWLSGNSWHTCCWR